VRTMGEMRSWVIVALIDGCCKISNFHEAISQPCSVFVHSRLTNYLCQRGSSGVITRKTADTEK
jgi:hypothetical protein